MILLRFLCLPFFLLGGLLLGFFGMLTYWFYYTFKKEKLYTKYGEDN